MGLTFNNRDTREVNKGTDFNRGVIGNLKYVEFEFNTIADTSPAYATGGIALTSINTKFGLATVTSCNIQPKDGFVFEYDIANDKILMRSDGGGTAGAPLAEEAAGAPAAVSNIKGIAYGHD